MSCLPLRVGPVILNPSRYGGLTMSVLKPILAALTLLVMLAQAPMAKAEPRSLSGTVTYLERMALPPEAVVEVQLLDVSLADAPAKLIAGTRIAPAGQVPVAYRLDYDDSQIQPGHSYALLARITLDDRLMFINATHHPVLDGGPDQTEITVNRVAAPATLEGRWRAEDIRGGGVIDEVQTTLEVSGDGMVSGSGGCNRLTGMASIDGDTISFGQMATTMMACPQAIMDQEQAFIAALTEARGWRIDPQTDRLDLLAKSGAVLVTFSRF